MAWWVKVSATKTHDLNSIPRTPDEKREPTITLSCLTHSLHTTYKLIHAFTPHSHIHTTHIHTTHTFTPHSHSHHTHTFTPHTFTPLTFTHSFTPHTHSHHTHITHTFTPHTHAHHTHIHTKKLKRKKNGYQSSKKLHLV